MESFKLNISSSLGNPTDPKTWSATPYNICKVLEEKGKLGLVVDSRFASKYVKAPLKLLSMLQYQRSQDMARGNVYRYYRSYLLKKKLETASSIHTLHMGTYDLPFLTLDKRQKHYLYVDTTWNLWSQFSSEMSNYSEKLIKDAESLEKKAYSQLTHIFSISHYVKQNLMEHYGVSENKISVVGTGRGIIQPYFGKKDYHNGKILFVAKGRFEDKGGFLVLDAFKLALKQNPELSLTIVGQHDYSSKIKQENVTTLGFIKLEQLQQLFIDHSLFVMPAINEPWGLVYLEALSCKMPIIGLNKNSFPEISQNGKYGSVIDSPDPLSLAEIMVNSFKYPDILNEKGEQGQDFCLKTFTWNEVVEKIVKTIEEQYL